MEFIVNYTLANSSKQTFKILLSSRLGSLLLEHRCKICQFTIFYGILWRQMKSVQMFNFMKYRTCN